MTDLTENQQILLRAVGQAVEPMSTAALAVLHKADGSPFGDNAARNALGRLDARGLLAGSGAGQARTWVPTHQGHELISELLGVAVDPDESLGADLRGYVVLEEIEVDGEPLYRVVCRPTSRNTEHALRQTAKQVYGDTGGAPTLVPVAEKMWKPTKVTLNNRQTVSIG